MAFEIISYVDAKAKGLKRYFTGKPCKRGHLAERNVANCACVECQAAVTTKWGKENGDRKREIFREWRKRHPEYDAEWVRANPEMRREIARRWYVANQEHAVEVASDWQRRNPESRRANTRNRYARKIQAEGSHTAEEITAMLDAQGWGCADCGISIRERRHIDHIHPLSKGGSNDIGNLQGLCPTCNIRKSDKDPLDWARQNGRLL